MNKKTKGLVAGIAGAAILAGSAGTFALWRVSDDLGDSLVNTGRMTVTAGSGQWTDQSVVVMDRGADSTGKLISNPGHQPNGTFFGIELGNDKLVPGDIWVGRFPVTETLEGTNIAAELYIPASPVAGVAGVDASGDPVLTPLNIEGLVITAAIVEDEGDFFAEVKVNWGSQATVTNNNWTDSGAGMQTPITIDGSTQVVLTQVRTPGAPRIAPAS